MAIATTIQWTDSSVNPTKGCDGCELWNKKTKSCYAGRLTQRFGRSNAGLADDFDVVELAPGRVAQATRWSHKLGRNRPGKPWLSGLPRLIFVGDMADNFSKAVPFDYLHDEVIVPIASTEGQHHQWQWLTKQPQQMADFSKWLEKRSIPWPANLWVGTSLTTQSTTTRLRSLRRVGDQHTIRFVSVEPQWGPIDLRNWMPDLDWVIQGGHSGSNKHPFALEWADDLREQCREFRVPYFLKQLGSCVTANGEKIRGRRGHNGDWDKWPARLRVRQMPIYVGRRRSRSVRQRKILASPQSR